MTPLVDRRRLLQLGGLGALGLSLPEFLASRASAAGYGGNSKERSCIFIVQYGGAPHHDTFDPKPDAPSEIRGLYRPIPTSVPGTFISEKLPLLAARADRYALVRSMSHGSGGHMDGMHVCLSAQSNGSNADNSPYLGSVVAKVKPSTKNMPSYVWLQNLAGDVGLRYEAGGTLGAIYAPLRVGKDLDNPAAPNFRFQAFDPVSGTSPQKLSERQTLLAELQSAGRAPLADAGPTSITKFQERALQLVTGSEARRAFDLSQEPDTMRQRYGAHPLGQNLLMARRLIEAGVRMVNVTAWAGVPEGEAFRNVQTWDMHAVLYSGTDNIYGNSAYGLNFVLPRLDQAVSTLLDDLQERGLLNDTLVVMVGEFGRTPKFENGHKGRGHWPNAYTALLAGGGIRGGAVYGESDRQGAFVKSNPVTPEDFGATVFHALGLPTRYPDDIAKRISAGEPVRQLFS